MYGSIFCCSVPGEKAEALAGFYRGTRKDNAIDLLGEQRADRHGYGDIGLAGAAGSDAEHHVVLFDFFHVAALAGVFRGDDFFSEGTLAAVFEHAARRFVGLVGGDMDQRLHFGAGEFSPVTGDVIVFLDDLDGVVDVVLVAFDAEAIVVQVRAHMQRVFEQAHIFIQRAEKGFNLSGNVNGTPHSDGEQPCSANGLADG